MQKNERLLEVRARRPRPAAAVVDASSLWSDCRARLMLPARWTGRAALQVVRRLAGTGPLALTAAGAAAHPALPLYALPTPIQIIPVDWEWDNGNDECLPKKINKRSLEETCLGTDVVDNNCVPQSESVDKKEVDLFSDSTLIETENNGGSHNDSETDLSEAKRRALLVLQRIERGAPRRKRNRKRRTIDQNGPCARKANGEEEKNHTQIEDISIDAPRLYDGHLEPNNKDNENDEQREQVSPGVPQWPEGRAGGAGGWPDVLRNKGGPRGPRVVRGLP